jgi:hypothetical protein
MGKVIEVGKNVAREKLDAELAKIKSKRKTIDLDKYFGKVDFKMDGLKYQLDIRNEWN